MIGVALVAAAAVAQPVPTTIDALLAHPDAYADKEVRLTGQIDQCQGFVCSLCPLDMTQQSAAAAHCLELSFDRLSEPEFPGADTDALYRFADVTLIARFDPTCLPGHLPPSICLDKGSVLDDADVQEILRRRSSRDGLWLVRQTPLRLAPAEIAKPVLAEIRLQYRNDRNSAGPSVRVFVTDARTKPPEAIACTLWDLPEDKPPDTAWPVSREAAILSRSVADRYRCRRARLTVDGWRVLSFP